MNTEFFRARLEEVRSNLELTRADKRKTLENLLERSLTQELKEVLRNNLSLLIQAEEKYLELERQYEILIRCGRHWVEKVILIKIYPGRGPFLSNKQQIQ